MKRRTFIIKAIAAATVISVPAFYYTCRSPRSHDPLLTPDMLSRFCDEETIREIGKHYLALKPAEAQKEKLTRLILGSSLTSSDSSFITGRINDNIKKDFESERIVVIDGWVLSATEARQCALFSFDSK